VEDFIYTSLFLSLSTTMAPKGENTKVDFSRKPELRFFCECTPRRDLPNGMTPDPLPPLGAELGAPKNWGQPKKSFTSGFRGSKFLPPETQQTSPENSGFNSRLVNGVLPPCPKTCFICGTFSPKSAGQIWIKLKIYTLQISGRPDLAFHKQRFSQF